MDHLDFQKIRKEYQDNGIDVHDLNACPLKQLESWIEEANQHSPGEWFETNAMALATASPDGDVSVRYVLLKGFDENGLRFFTNYDSHKGQQLADNPRCSVALHWPFMGRQIRIRGSVTKTSREISQQYFHSRPQGAQIGAAISDQSQPLEDRDELESKMKTLSAEVADGTVPLPENWGGYQIDPDHFEFWQGRTSRLHDRIVYRKDNDGWARIRLAP